MKLLPRETADWEGEVLGKAAEKSKKIYGEKKMGGDWCGCSGWYCCDCLGEEKKGWVAGRCVVMTAEKSL